MSKRIIPTARKENLVIQDLKGEILIYDLKTNRAYCLNESSAKIWQFCDGKNDVPQIGKLLKKHFNSSVSEDFVWLALDQLKKANLIKNEKELAINFNGLTRRAVIRKTLLATVVTLPVISSLVAPIAAKASSTSGGGVCIPISCSNSNQCKEVGCNNCRNNVCE